MSAEARASLRRRLRPSEQPGLPIALPGRALPAPVAPEASTPCAAAFDGDAWLFSVDWDGARCLLITDEQGHVRLQGETAVLDARFPEIVAAAAAGRPRSLVLDGTICVLDAEGRPDVAAMSLRVAGGSNRPATVYLATDLLQLDGRPLLTQPLLTRLAGLAEVVAPGSRIQVPDNVVGHGCALAEAATQRGLHAVIARRQGAPYRGGVASPDRLRIALTGRRAAVVVGMRHRPEPLRILLADWTEGRLRLVGAATVRDQVARRWLLDTAEHSTGADVEDGGAGGADVAWIRPRLVATVERDETAAATGADVAWTLVALRDDVDPKWCVRRSPVPPPQARAARPLRPFSPTVLSALPIDGAA